MNQIRTIIFDFDGTLAHTQEAIRHSFVQTLNEIKGPIPIEPYLNEIACHSTERMFREIGVVDEEIVQHAVRKYNQAYRRIGPGMARLFTGVPETLNTLKAFGFSLAIGTNEVRENLEILLPTLDIGQHFPVTVCQDEVSRPKPHPELVHKILNDTGSLPCETLIVGDSVVDVEVGKATGCHTCGVTYGTHTEEKLRAHCPDWLIHYPTELLWIVGPPPVASSVLLQEPLVHGVQL